MANPSKITADGTFEIIQTTGNSISVMLSNAFGGGTVTPGYINSAGTFIGFKDETEVVITFTAGFQIVIDCGIGCRVAVLVTGSTAPAITVDAFQMGR